MNKFHDLIVKAFKGVFQVDTTCEYCGVLLLFYSILTLFITYVCGIASLIIDKHIYGNGRYFYICNSGIFSKEPSDDFDEIKAGLSMLELFSYRINTIMFHTAVFIFWIIVLILFFYIGCKVLPFLFDFIDTSIIKLNNRFCRKLSEDEKKRIR